jgi:phage tail-like protein
MANDGLKQSGNTWPMPKFYFKVEWDKNIMSFHEVSGLDVQTQEISYRRGDSPNRATIQTPGIRKYGNITMKRGLFKGDSKFFDLFSQFKLNAIKRAPIAISLLDEAGVAMRVWTLSNAYPVKIAIADLKSQGNEVTIETMEFAHEGLTIANSQKKNLFNQRLKRLSN